MSPIKKVLFIINPISGVAWKNISKAKIDKLLSPKLANYKVTYTDYAGHATELALQAVVEKYDIVVAVGGDGSVNEIAKSLINTKVQLGIIPLGSGNGFARSLNIPILPAQALRNVFYGKVKAIDVGYVNDQPFFSTCGFGFDGIVSHDFAQLKSRGFFSYAYSMLRTFFKYRASKFEITTNGNTEKVKALSIIFANANQFGYNIKLSKKAEMDNGLFDLCIMEDVPKWKGLLYGLLFGLNQIESVRAFSVKKSKEAHIKIENPEYWHIDGDAKPLITEAKIRMEKQALQVIVPY